jgi:hypothetical protein
MKKNLVENFFGGKGFLSQKLFLGNSLDEKYFRRKLFG